MAVLLLFAELAVAQSTDNQSQGAASTAADQAQQAGSNAAGQAQQAGSSAADQAKQAGSNAAGQAQQAGSDAADAAKQGAQAGYDKAKEGANSAVDATKKAVTGSSTDQNAGEGQNASQEKQTGAPPAGQAGETAGTTSGAEHKHLPQTASPLPLLGLLGMGSLSFGLWKARRR